MKKFLFDFFPVFLFFLVFKLYPGWVPETESLCALDYCLEGGDKGAIYAATIAAILASFAQLLGFWLRHRRFENMHLITLALLVVLGGATLYFHNEAFIKWKPTVVNWLFALVFLGSQFIGGKPIIQRMMEANIQVNDAAVWLRLNLSWVGFFVAMGLLNLYVAFNFDNATWVNFKLFGMMGLTFVFVIAQALYLTRYLSEPAEETVAGEDQRPG